MLNMSANRAACLAALALVAPTVAEAASGHSDSFSITVVIPPLGAGVQAASEGAVGLDTLDQPGGGLLISAPDQVPQGGEGKIQVFSLAGGAVTARVGDAGPSEAPSDLAQIKTGAIKPLNGMDRTTFTVVPTTGALNPQTPGANIVSVVVSSL